MHCELTDQTAQQNVRRKHTTTSRGPLVQAALLVVSFALSWRMNKLTERSVKLREARHQLLHRCANELPLKAARELLGRYAPDGGNAYLSINPNMEKQMVDLRDGCRELLRIVDHLVCVRGSEVPREQLEAELGPVAALVKKYAQHLSPAAQELLTAGMGERILGLMGATPTAAKAGSATPRGGGQRNARTPHAGAATPRAAPNSTVLHTIHDDDAAEAASPGEEALLTAQPPSSGRVRRRLHTDDKDATEPSTGGDDVVVSNGASDSDGAAEESGNHTKAA